jgi:hypothetical protein
VPSSDWVILQVRPQLDRGPHYLLVVGVGICTFQSHILIWASRTVWLRFSLRISTATHSQSYSPCSFAPVLPTFLLVEPDQTKSCACSSQRPAAGRPCASPSHWQMKRRRPPRSITLPRIIKVMPWSVMLFFLSPSNWIGEKKVADISGRAHSGHYCRRRRRPKF